MNECWPSRSSSFLRSTLCSELWSWHGEGDRHAIATGRSACFDVETVVEIDGVKVGPTRSHVALRNMRIERSKSSQTTPASSDSSSSFGSSSEFELALVFEKPGRYTLPILDITRIRCKYLHQGKASIEARDSLFVFTAASQDELERLVEVVRDVKAVKTLADSRLCTSCKERGELKKVKRKQKRELQQQQPPTDSEPTSWLDGECQATKKQKLKVLECAFRRKSLPSPVDTDQEHVYCIRDLLKSKEHGSRKASKMGMKPFEGGDSLRVQSDDEFYHNAFSQDDLSSENSCMFYDCEKQEQFGDEKVYVSPTFAVPNSSSLIVEKPSRVDQRTSSGKRNGEGLRAVSGGMEEKENLDVFGDEDLRTIGEEALNRFAQRRGMNELMKKVREEQKRVKEEKRRKEERRKFDEDERRESKEREKMLQRKETLRKLLEHERRWMDDSEAKGEEGFLLKEEDNRKPKAEEERFKKSFEGRLQVKDRSRKEKRKEEERRKRFLEIRFQDEEKQRKDEEDRLGKEEERMEEERRKRSIEKKLQEDEKRRKDEEDRRVQEELKQREEERNLQEQQLREEEQKLREKMLREHERKLLEQQLREEEQKLREQRVRDNERKLQEQQRREEEQKLREQKLREHERRLQEQKLREEELKLRELKLREEERKLQEKKLKEEEQKLREQRLREEEEQTLREQRLREEERKVQELQLREEEQKLQEQKLREERKLQEQTKRVEQRQFQGHKLREEEHKRVNDLGRRLQELKQNEDEDKQFKEVLRRLQEQIEEQLQEQQKEDEEKTEETIDFVKQEEDRQKLRQQEEFRKFHDPVKATNRLSHRFRRSRVSAEARMSPKEIRKILEEQLDRLDPWKLDEDLKRWRSEEIDRLAKEDSWTTSDHERSTLLEQRKKAEEVMKMSQRLNRKPSQRVKDDAETRSASGRTEDSKGQTYASAEINGARDGGEFQNRCTLDKTFLDHLFGSWGNPSPSFDSERLGKGRGSFKPTETFLKPDRLRQEELRKVELERKKAEKSADEERKRLAQERMKAAKLEAKRLDKLLKEAQRRAKAEERQRQQQKAQEGSSQKAISSSGFSRAHYLTYRQYEDAWNVLKTSGQKSLLAYSNIPWPPPSNPLFVEEGDSLAAQRRKLRIALLRWHPDKFQSLCGNRLSLFDKDTIEARAKTVAQEVIVWKSKLDNMS